MTLEVAIPDTTLRHCSDLREKTVTTGFLGRAFAVFRAEKIIVFETGRLNKQELKDADLLVRLLRYMDTPQYLRKRVFPRAPALRFVGLLPPLRTPSHPLFSSIEDIEKGELRWGIQIGPGKVDLGLDETIDYDGYVDEREPTLFRVVETKPRIKLEVTDRSETTAYWGFETLMADDLEDYLSESVEATTIALSREAPPFSKMKNAIEATVEGTESVLALFGGPKLGLHELFSQPSGLKDYIDFWINTIPGQGTETVRLEEAVFSSLALLNYSIGDLVAKKGFYE
ncbi:MAG: putative RNA uridine N3 methyltransferase [Candidatus Thorarchaeota archaeon]